MPEIPSPIVGVTADDVTTEFARILRALEKVRRYKMPTIRLVLDLAQAPTEYLEAVQTLHGTNGEPRLAYVMAEIADSDFLWKFNEEHKHDPDHLNLLERLDHFLNELGEYVDIWEIGNEVNGEWAGWKTIKDCNGNTIRDWQEGKTGRMRMTVGTQTLAMYSAVRAHPKTSDAATALTLYFYTKENEDCLPTALPKEDCTSFPVNKKDYEALQWLRDTKLIEHGTNFHPHYVLLSVYEEDCDYIEPPLEDWIAMFQALQGAFPLAKVGFGETGAQCNYRDDETPRSDPPCVQLQEKNVRKHYDELHREITTFIKDHGRQINYIGGYFYWYFQQDMLKSNSQPLAELLHAVEKWDE